ncbi:MAG: hypothetical protein IRY99_17610 [Isosphaeraceae bacterium]|nr:hypothetical protein [Isosphaeraceae bacterium]
MPTLPDAAPAPRPRRRASGEIPVARPAPPRPKLRDDPDEVPQAELLTPTSIKGWVTSLSLHAFLLLVLALWYLAPKRNEASAFDARVGLEPGTEFGSDLGTQLKGGLGMDEPLALPLAAEAEPLQTPVFTTIPQTEIKLDQALANQIAKTADGSPSGGGVATSGTGQAGLGDGFGVAKFGHGGENINGVQVKVGDPQFTLIWDSRADLDIHVVEPGGSEIFWPADFRRGAQGGELDVDDIDGFGPENVNWIQGQGPIGTYRWFVHYYGAPGGIAIPTRWKVRVKHNGVTQVYQGKLFRIDETSRIYTLKVEGFDTNIGAKSGEAASK